MNYFIMLSNALQILIPFVEFLKLLFDFQSFQKMKGLPRNCSVLRIFISIFSFLFFGGGGKHNTKLLHKNLLRSYCQIASAAVLPSANTFLRPFIGKSLKIFCKKFFSVFRLRIPPSRHSSISFSKGGGGGFR